MTDPKLFISYSWTSPEHEEWVLNLATELQGSGVDVIFDKWDLKEGEDANAFMEKMVTDDEIKKVIMVCDQTYAEKANSRAGGVGTETQIISPEVYAQQGEGKFVAVIKEKDENGKSYVPAYYGSRIFIDLSDPSAYFQNMEQLLRWVFDKALYKKPPLGKRPSFLSEDERSISLATSLSYKRALDAVRNSQNYAYGAVQEYFDLCSDELEKFRMDAADVINYEKVMENIEAFLPYRNELIQLFLALNLYHDSEQAVELIHRFFEKLIPYVDRPNLVYANYSENNYIFVVHELFLYAVASFLKYEKFIPLDAFLSKNYYLPHRANTGYLANTINDEDVVTYDIFIKNCQIFADTGVRAQKNKKSRWHLVLNERCKNISLTFQDVMQADFVVYLRNFIGTVVVNQTSYSWDPLTLSGLAFNSGSFEVFSRSRSRSYFEKFKILLDVDSADSFKSYVSEYETPISRYMGINSLRSANLKRLIAFDIIARDA